MVNLELTTFHISCVGYSHQKTGKPCQDHSTAEQLEDRAIITACDGHGGSLYIRSQQGSRFASEAVLQVFGSMEKEGPLREKKTRLELLCAWNDAVERDFTDNPFLEEELAGLSDEQKFLLSQNPFLAYGTTMHGVVAFGNGRLICAGIGDGGLFGITGDSVIPLAEQEDDDTVANITHSLCEEHAEKNLIMAEYDFAGFEAVLACTDGTINPYQNLENFERAFIRPILAHARDGQWQTIQSFMARLGSVIGIGDDVTLSLIQKANNSEQKTNAEGK